jgi:hypothetical protein
MLGATLAAVAVLATGGPSATIGREHVALDDHGARVSVDFDGAVHVTRRPAPREVEPGDGPQRSPDGHWIATRGAGPIWIAPAARPSQRIRVEGSHFWTIPLVWAPDSQHIAYLRRLPGSLELVVAGSTGGAHVLVRRVCESPVSWSPDGRRLAVEVPRPRVGCGRGGIVDLAVVGLDGHVRRVARRVAGTPEWSPSGPLILLSGGRIETVRADGARRRKLAGYGPAWWSPDGRWIAAVTGFHSTFVLLRADGTGRRVLGDYADSLGGAGFSPDGRYVVARLDGGLVLAELDTSRQTRIPVDGYVNFGSPAWSGGTLSVNARAYRPGD